LKKSLQRKLVWRFVGAGSALIAAQVVRAALDRGYEAARGSEPPQKPWMKGNRLRNTLLWTATTAIAISMAEVLAEYGASQAWRKKTGKLPPV
jgi:hypothetical protein